MAAMKRAMCPNCFRTFDVPEHWRLSQYAYPLMMCHQCATLFRLNLAGLA